MSDEVQEREVARRVFAAEFDDATLSYSESDEERAPNYVVTPTGARVNRLFAAGALTEVEQVNENVLRGRIVDPTGAFVTYGGQYQPDAAAFLERATPPCFVAITGKARTYQPDDSDRIFTSVRPESLTEVDAGTRDRWVVAAADATLDRIATVDAALDLDVRGDDLRAALESQGVDAAFASGVALALDHYRPTEYYLEAVRTLAVQSLELVAGTRDTVEALDAAPDEPGPNELGPLPDVPAAPPAPSGATTEPDDTTDESPATADVDVGAAADPDADNAADADAAEAVDGTPAAETGDGMSPAEAVDDTSPAEAVDDGSTAAATDHVPTGGTSATEAAGGTSTTDDESAGDASLSSPTEDPPSTDAAAEPRSTGSAPADSDTSTPADDGADTAADPDGDLDDLGDFGTDDEPDESEMYELDDEERAEIESEFGTEFATGNEVDDPGEADIDVPDADELEAEAAAAAGSDAGDPDDATAAAADAGPSSDSGTPATPATDPVPTGGETGAAAPDAGDSEPPADDADDDVDLEAAAVDVMSDLDGGDGADREAVVAAVVEQHGADPDAVESAIQDALMGGKCYEPAEGRLKAI